MEKLISGPLLHVDETKVNLLKGSGYVWVFTNMEEVVFVLRPDRNAAFLHELLREFHGVLATISSRGMIRLNARSRSAWCIS